MPVLKSLTFKFFACAIVCCVAVVGHAQKLDSRWDLRVVDTQHRVKVIAKIQFTENIAPDSCMGGTWKRVAVEARTTQDERFFSLAGPIAYRLQHGELTLGSTTICDGYALLSGKSDASNIQGTYNTVGMGGSQKLGFFSLRKVQ